MNTKTTIIAALAASAFAFSLSAQPQNQGSRPARPDAETVVAKLIADFDADENNTLDVTELTAGLTDLRATRQARMEARAERRGIASDDAAANAPRPGRANPPTPEVAAKRMIEDFDANADGVLDAAELYEAFSSKRGFIGPRQGWKGGR